MARKKQSEVLTEEMEIIRAELRQIGQLTDAPEDDIARGEELMADLDEKERALNGALAREAKLEEILRASRRPALREGGHGPQLMMRTDPYDDNDHLHRSLIGRANFNHEEVISRAQTAVDQGPKYLSDSAKGRMHELLELDNVHAPLIARHMLLTGSDEYHDEFRDYIKSRGYRVGEAMRAALSLTDANGGRVAALVG